MKRTRTVTTREGERREQKKEVLKEKERQIKKSSASVPKLAKELGKKFLVLRKGGSERRLLGPPVL